MKSELEAVGLIALLFVVTFALGFEFGGSGLSGVFGGPGPSTVSNKPNPFSLSLFIVRAEGANPAAIYASSFHNATPANGLVPLVGVRAMLVAAGRTQPTGLVRLPTIVMITNSSGVAAAYLTPGDYVVRLAGSTFSTTTAVILDQNATATLSFRLSASVRAVSGLKVVSPDSISGLEPTSTMYAFLNYTSAPSTGFSELIGYEPASSAVLSGSALSTTGSVTLYQNKTAAGGIVTLNSTIPVGPELSLNATLLGAHRGTQGYWATLLPSAAYPEYPSVDVMLFQFKSVVEVNYTAS